MNKLPVLIFICIHTLAKGQVTLAVGDDAPVLKIEKWIKGGGYDSLKKGRVYVIDLWATWCTPCIASMPHLSALQEKHKEKGLEVIGITSEDKWGNTFAKASEMADKKKAIINYSLAWLLSSRDKDGTTGIFNHEWMQRMKINYLPYSFIVDRNGKIAYAGDPHTIDKPLEQIMNGTYDLTNAAAQFKDEIDAKALLVTFKSLLKDKKYEDALKQATFLMQNFQNLNTKIYLSISANIIDNFENTNTNAHKIALEAAKKAVVLTQFESPGFLDNLAAVYAAHNDLINAIITEKLAISLSEGEMKEHQIKNLEKYIEKIGVK